MERIIFKVLDFIVSMRLMAILIIIFALSIGTATFIENDFGTNAAKYLVYNATWFEMLLILIIINLVSNIILRKLYQKRKFTVFLFHLAFVFIILGAGITRFIGFEGMMHIREGEKSNYYLSNKAFLQIANNDENRKIIYSQPLLMSELSKNSISTSIGTGEESWKINSTRFISNAMQMPVNDDSQSGIVQLIIPGDRGRESIYLNENQLQKIGQWNFMLSDADQKSSVHHKWSDEHAQVVIYPVNDSLYIEADHDMEIINKSDWSSITLVKHKSHPLEVKTLYKVGEQSFVLSKHWPSASLKPVHHENNGNLPDAILFRASKGEKTKTFYVTGKPNYLGNPKQVNLGRESFFFTYGSLPRQLPFSLKLNEFIVEHYPGSDSPSWFESKISLMDPRNDYSSKERIFMNNVLKYKGYRFYQSSYDQDEKGTVLSVNRDLWGTLVTYAGYLMLTLGMLLSLFNKNSRFQYLQRMTRNKTTILLIFSILFSMGVVHGKEWRDSLERNRVNKMHAKEFGKLLVQDNNGRIKPLNTLNSELLRKISRKSQIYGMSSDQVVLGMSVQQKIWQDVPLIKVGNDQIKNYLGITSDYAAFSDFIRAGNKQNYVLASMVQEAYRKKPAYRNKFDNALIKVDERVNICYFIFSNGILKVFPRPQDENNEWFAPGDVARAFASEDSVFVSNIDDLYFNAVVDGIHSGNWEDAGKYLGYISVFQERFGEEVIPSDFKQKAELWYNKAYIFQRISYLYGLIGLVMLIFLFIRILKPAYQFRGIITAGFILITIVFIIHAAGLGLRWYIAGHAPWSNGYEALIYISWATVLAGLLFASRSRIALAVTAILASLILHVAHLSWMDPEITTLVPVLKSVWLVIHVAIITASYGFLALGALMALVNLIIILFVSGKNQSNINTQVHKLTHIIEMTLIAGLYMLTIGTFLGGVWANESWGRYWGWDPKETWALVTILVYSFIAHMRMIPGLKSIFAFNLLALFGFSSVIMTYFGVNYYLSGLHSYAKGDPLPIPDFVYYTVTILTVISVMAYINYRKFNWRLT